MSEQPAPRWSADQVLALAPDPSSVSAARKLTGSAGWSEQGCDASAVWGLCAGSGKNPYRTVVDVSGPAYQCSCPSRKFPCKHSLALLLRWASGEIPVSGERPDFAAQWLDGRSERAQKSSERAAQAKPVDTEAQAKRAAAREVKVSGGMQELSRWTQDQIRSGIAQLQGKGYRPFETMAARLVDAQAPAAASKVRALPGVMASGPGWPDRMLEELALLDLLARSHERLEEIAAADSELAAAVRSHVGYPVAKADVLARPGVYDRWLVAAVRDSELDNLTQRTNYLLGLDTGTLVVVLSFAPAGGIHIPTLPPGQVLSGPVHLYPGSQRRGLLAEANTTPVDPHVLEGITGLSVAGALDAVAMALAGDPWLRSLPLLVHAQPVADGSGWLLVDREGVGIELRGGHVWELVNACGGDYRPVLVEWTPTGWNPIVVLAPDVGLVAV